MKNCFIVMVLGYWGRGKSIKEAAQNCTKSGGQRTDRTVVKLVLNDDKAQVDSQGYLVREPGSEVIDIGNGLKLGQLTLYLED